MSHKVSTEILQIQEWSQLNLMKWCAVVFFSSLQMNHLYSYIKHRERLLSYSTSPRSLVRNNHKENHLNAFCWGWEVTFASFPIHSYLPLDLIEADYSLISIPFLTTPLDCSKLTWSLSVCCLRKRCHVLFDTGPVTCRLIRVWGWLREQRALHKMCARDSFSVLLAGHLKLLFCLYLSPIRFLSLNILNDWLNI